MAEQNGVIKQFLVALGFKADEKSLKKFSDGIKTATGRVTLFAAAVTATAGVVGAGMVKVARESEALGYLAKNARASVASLEEAAHVAEQLGVSADTARASIAGLGTFLQRTPGGDGFLRSVGVATRDANGQLRDTGHLLFDLGERIKGLPRWRQEAILSRVGVSSDMITVLTDDVSGLRRAFQDMYAVAGVDADKAAESSRGFMNELRMLSGLVTMLGRAVSLTFVDGMRKDISRFRLAVMENFKPITEVFSTVIGLVLRLARFFGAMAVRGVQWASKLLEWFNKLPKGTKAVIAGVLGLVAAWKLLNLSFLAAPVGAVFLLAVALAALYDDYLKWKEGGTSLIDWTKWAPGVEKAIAAIKSIINWLGQYPEVIGAVVGAFVGFKVVAPVLGPVLAAFRGLLGLLRMLAMLVVAHPLLALIAALVIGAGLVIANWDKVRAKFESFFTWAGEQIDWLLGLVGDVGNAVIDALPGMRDLVNLGSDVADGVSDLGKKALDFFGFADEAPPAALPSAVLAPSPAAQAQMRAGASVTIDQRTEIKVSGSHDPEATGSAVAREQRRVNSDMQRNMQGAVR